jgi:hypothetical protein
MTPEERKEYNKTYYANNKPIIIKNMLMKVECDKCKRIVSHSRLKNHKKSKLCEKFANLVIHNSES